MSSMITIQSFSFRAPPEVVMQGFVFDCRMLVNPGREERFRNLTGLDSPVRDFFKQHSGEIEEFLRPIKALVGFAAKAYGRKGHTNLTVSFGCMGGQHRSVYCAERLSEWLRTSLHVQVATRHLVIGGKGSEPVHGAKGGKRICTYGL